jgi:DNA polymerase V
MAEGKKTDRYRYFSGNHFLEFYISGLGKFIYRTYERYMRLHPPIPFQKRTTLRIPLFTATVEAGFPSPADDHLERSIDLNEELIRNKAATFLVRVKGESMRDAGIHAGDVLVVDRSVTPKDKQIVVAMIDGGFTVKRFRKMNERIYLEAENAEFASIEVGEDQELTIWGAVTYIIHRAR